MAKFSEIPCDVVRIIGEYVPLDTFRYLLIQGKSFDPDKLPMRRLVKNIKAGRMLSDIPDEYLLDALANEDSQVFDYALREIWINNFAHSYDRQRSQYSRSDISTAMASNPYVIQNEPPEYFRAKTYLPEHYLRLDFPYVNVLNELRFMYPQFSQNLEAYQRLLSNPAMDTKIIEYVASFLDNWIESVDIVSTNISPKIVNYLIEHPDRINWPYFSANPAAAEFVLKPENANNVDVHALLKNSKVPADILWKIYKKRKDYYLDLGRHELDNEFDEFDEFDEFALQTTQFASRTTRNITDLRSVRFSQHGRDDEFDEFALYTTQFASRTTDDDEFLNNVANSVFRDAEFAEFASQTTQFASRTTRNITDLRSVHFSQHGRDDDAKFADAEFVTQHERDDPKYWHINDYNYEDDGMYSFLENIVAAQILLDSHNEHHQEFNEDLATYNEAKIYAALASNPGLFDIKDNGKHWRNWYDWLLKLVAARVAA